MKNSFLIICIFFVLKIVLLSSCGKNYFFYEKKEIQNAQWSYADSLSFSVDIEDISSSYQLYLDIDHSTQYSFENIYIRIHTELPNGNRTTERVSIKMMNEIGIWKGDCNSENCQLNTLVKKDALFKSKGKHTFTIEQFMRNNPLRGINSIALQIEKVQSK